MIKNFRFTLRKIIPVIILVGLAFTYRDVLRSMVLIPLAYLIFVFRLIASNIGQQTLWISFVVFSSLIAVLSLAMRREVQPRETDVENKYPTRLQTWINTVSRNGRSPYFKWNLSQDLSNLFIEAIAYHQGISRHQVLQQLQAGQIDLPSDILEYLQISQKPFIYSGSTSRIKFNWLMDIWETIIKRSTQDKTEISFGYRTRKNHPLYRSVLEHRRGYLG